MTPKLKTYDFQGNCFQVTRGDYAPILQKVVDQLEKAKVGSVRGGGLKCDRQEEMVVGVMGADHPPYTLSHPGLCCQLPPRADAGPVYGELHAGLHRGP